MASISVKTASEIRDDILRVIESGLIRRGITTPDITPGSDFYVLATGIAYELEVIGATVQVKADAQMVDTATGQDLIRIANIFGLDQRAAAPAYGFVTYEATATTVIAAGTQLVDKKGLRFQVQVGGSYANGASIPVIGVDTGAGTNHSAGDVLKWVAQPTYASPTVTVATGGLTGGIDAEDDETLRARILDRLRNPPGAGNWSQIATFAEESSTIVQKAFVYPAANGPATVHVVVVGYATSTGKTRNVDTTTLNGTIKPYILGSLPEYVETTITTVTNVNTDVGIGLSLPAATTASPAGPGGGWVNGTPWPVQTSSGYANVTAITTAGTRFTVATSATCPVPLAGVTEIAWLSTVDWKLYTAKVTSYNGSAAPSFDITIDTPFTGIAVGDYVWPNCVNAQDYIDALLDAFAMMGPGEKTSATGVLSRAYRHPLPGNSWPYSLGPSQLRAITDVGDEVLDAQWLYRSTTTPAVPASVTDPANILVPRYVGFYAL